MPQAQVARMRAVQRRQALQTEIALLEAQRAVLLAELVTLDAAITAMRRRYPGVEAEWQHWHAREESRQR